MADMGRPKSEHSKRKILSVRIGDALYQQICSYAEQHNTSVAEVVLFKNRLSEFFRNSDSSYFRRIDYEHSVILLIWMSRRRTGWNG